MVYLCVFMAFLAFISGLAAVGSGSSWRFQAKHLAQGRLDALMYLWVTCSTIFSMSHIALLLLESIQHTSTLAAPSSMVGLLNSSVSLLFLLAHLLILKANTFNDLLPSITLWGKQTS